MRAILQHRYGGAEALDYGCLDVPSPGPTEVLVRVRAAGVDRGAYHLMRGLPYLVRLLGNGVLRPKHLVPGTNVAGVVEAVGAEVTDLRAGLSVYGTAAGAFAEYVCASRDAVAPKPGVLSYSEAAVLPYAATVSLQALRDRAHVRSGQSVLVVGASGAVGSIAVQIAKALGANVTGVCSRAHADEVLALGADHVIAHDGEEDGLGGTRYDVVVDVGGNTPLRRLRRTLAARGHLVIIGGEGGGPILGGVHRQLGATLRSPFSAQTLGTLIARDGAPTLLAVNELVDSAGLRPVMGRTLPLADAAEAVDDLHHRRTFGRLALIP